MPRTKDADYEVDEQSTALAVLTELVGRVEAISLGDLVDSFGSRRQDTLSRAIKISLFCGLLEVVNSWAAADLVQLTRNIAAPRSAVLRLTDAGRIWNLCSPASKAAREKEKRMSDAKGPRFNFYKGSNNNVNYAEGDIVGQQTHFHARPSDDQVLQALSDLLRRTDLPWNDPALAEIRPILEQSVEQRNTKHPALMNAVHKLLGFGGAIALGVGGNTAYEVLKTFAS